MGPGFASLCADTCRTIKPEPLTALIAGEVQPLAPPLRDRISFDCADEKAQMQAATYLQLAAVAQTLRHPWLNFDGLYRLIVASDRSKAIQANGHHLECIGQSVQDHLQRSGACAFPTRDGILVILPLRILAYALEPENEQERQYGLTTIWHELAHVYDLTLHYSGKTGQWPPVNSLTPSHTRQAWHEYFADRHSHWPGFSVEFEVQLADQALTQAIASKSQHDIAALATRLASTYGRLAADKLELDQIAPPLANRLGQLGTIAAWTVCVHKLDDALAEVTSTGCAPELKQLNDALTDFHRAVAISHL